MFNSRLFTESLPKIKLPNLSVSYIGNFVTACVVMIVGLFSALSWSQANQADYASQVENIRLWHSPDRTRVVFDVSKDVVYKMFQLDQPRRLVVDIENADLSNKLPDLNLDNPHVSAIRNGRPKDNVLRFVFDLKKPLEANEFVLSPNELYGHRLVVDIEDKDKTSALRHADLTTSNVSNSPADANSTRAGSSLAGGQSPTPAVVKTIKKDRPIVIAIDAGHGGEDPGALGYSGSREKRVTLAIAKRLQKIIDQNPKMRSYMVRKGDYYIDLNKRRKMARDSEADMFISLHADAFSKKSARGFSVFAVSSSGATSAKARRLAAKENASDLIGGVSLADKDDVLRQVLVDLSMSNTINESLSFGGRVLRKLERLGKLHSRRVEQAGFAVLKSAEIPSVLIETGFITNPDEERKLKSDKYQQQVASAIYSAIDEYFEGYSFRNEASFAKSPYVGPDYQSLVTPESKISQRASTRAIANSRSSKPIPATHTIVRGDSLSKIAQRYGLTLAALKKHNRLTSNTAVLGKRLKLPGGSDASNGSLFSGVHTVARGDSLSRISERYNVTIRAIKSANNLSKNILYPGQKLTIPGTQSSKSTTPGKPRIHKVGRGDTLSEIAAHYGSTTTKIVRANALSSRTIILGQVLRIPH
jgi:N-acetylmuramoyl-L-alanine amidase